MVIDGYNILGSIKLRIY